MLVRSFFVFPLLRNWWLGLWVRIGAKSTHPSSSLREVKELQHQHSRPPPPKLHRLLCPPSLSAAREALRRQIYQTISDSCSFFFRCLSCLLNCCNAVSHGNFGVSLDRCQKQFSAYIYILYVYLFFKDWGCPVFFM